MIFLCGARCLYCGVNFHIYVLPYFGLVQEERSLQLEVELLGNWLHEVTSRSPVQNEEAVLRIAVSLVHEERSLRLRLLPLVGRKPEQ